ncbi:hypothetical protein F5B19DRAFT_223462 [Rostrohypoxylon terebratum]|nr:hypothetical protein F5B19DRAFT_223462 [Rostrohypoxylon terebratum]
MNPRNPLPSQSYRSFAGRSHLDEPMTPSHPSYGDWQRLQSGLHPVEALRTYGAPGLSDPNRIDPEYASMDVMYGQMYRSIPSSLRDVFHDGFRNGVRNGLRRFSGSTPNPNPNPTPTAARRVRRAPPAPTGLHPIRTNERVDPTYYEVSSSSSSSSDSQTGTLEADDEASSGDQHDQHDRPDRSSSSLSIPPIAFTTTGETLLLGEEFLVPTAEEARREAGPAVGPARIISQQEHYDDQGRRSVIDIVEDVADADLTMSGARQ